MVMKNAVESLYNGTCDIYEYRPCLRQNGSTELEEILVIEGQPCRLSYTTRLSYSGLRASSSKQRILANFPVQQIKLFLSPDIYVKPGSRIVVTQNGLTQFYRYSGETAKYRLHQEIVLEYDRENAEVSDDTSDI